MLQRNLMFELLSLSFSGTLQVYLLFSNWLVHVEKAESINSAPQRLTKEGEQRFEQRKEKELGWRSQGPCSVNTLTLVLPIFIVKHSSFCLFLHQTQRKSRASAEVGAHRLLLLSPFCVSLKSVSIVVHILSVFGAVHTNVKHGSRALSHRTSL